MKTSVVKNGLVVAVVLLFIGVAVQPSIGLSTDDDTTPPVTTYTLDPPEPDGLNGWYVSDINITFNATDDMSGVKEIRYTINGEAQHVIHGSSGTIWLCNDGRDIEVKYWAIDNAGNVEPKKTIMPLIDMDQTVPQFTLCYEFEFDPLLGSIYIFYVNAIDYYMSGMNRVEFYLDDVLQEIVYGPGPLYEWIWDCFDKIRVEGFILNPEITEEYVRFYAILVKISELYNYSHVNGVVPSAYAYDNAGNWDVLRIEYWPCSVAYYRIGLNIFKRLTLPNNYSGHLGRFFIYAIFDTS